jgi:basic membrane protein A
LAIPSKWINRVIAILLGLSLAACNLPTPDCARPEVFCVGLVTAFGGVDDHSLNQSAWEGVQQARAEGLISQANFIETVDARDRTKNIRSFLEDGYDLIVTVGLSMEEDTRLAADEWPGVAFIGVDQPQGELRANLATITFPEDQGGFLAGALAALTTSTGKVAALCEVQSLPSMWRYCEGFRVGAQYAVPGLRARVLYKGEGATSELFQDPKWGSEQALFMLDGGVDTLFAAGGETARAALETAASHGAYVIGTEDDMYYQLENADFALSSAMKQAGKSVYTVIRLLMEGKFSPGEHRGEYALGPYHSLERRVPATVQGRLEQIRIGLADGSITTGIPPEP